VRLDSSPIEIEQIRYKSNDATEIPMFLVARKERRSSRSLPVFLTAYGGFGACLTPQFYAYSTFLIEQGFLFAVANIRGGGEFGVEWHLAGKRRNRQNAIDDFISAAEWLSANAMADSTRIAVGGGSNAGLLVGAALTQKPHLFRAVVCLGPLLDMLRYHLFDSARSWTDEYGCSENQDDFPYMLAYSPYHNVHADAPYPAVLFVSGDADTRCNPMHVRKMVARLQRATSSDKPILLDYQPTWGHAPVQPLNRRIEALTDRLAFICHEMDVRAI
jgi:prolyl oligopeptidase